MDNSANHSGSWEDNLEEAIRRQTMKETGDYDAVTQADTDTVSDVMNQADTDTVSDVMNQADADGASDVMNQADTDGASDVMNQVDMDVVPDAMNQTDTDAVFNEVDLADAQSASDMRGSSGDVDGVSADRSRPSTGGSRRSRNFAEVGDEMPYEGNAGMEGYAGEQNLHEQGSVSAEEENRYGGFRAEQQAEEEERARAKALREQQERLERSRVETEERRQQAEKWREEELRRSEAEERRQQAEKRREEESRRSEAEERRQQVEQRREEESRRSETEERRQQAEQRRQQEAPRRAGSEQQRQQEEKRRAKSEQREKAEAEREQRKEERTERRRREREQVKEQKRAEERETRRQRRQDQEREQEEADQAVRDSDAVLFDEVVDDSGLTAKERKRLEKEQAREAKKREKEERKGTGRHADDYDDYDSYQREEDDRRYGEGHRFRSRREQQEYEDFLEYKAEKERYGRKKKKHRFLKFLLWLVIILLVLYCIASIGLRMLGIRRTDLNISDIRSMISKEVQQSAQSGAMADYRNYALFGVDSIDQSLDSGNNRTDVMIIASVNKLTGDVKLVSLYRDTYLDIGDGNYQKANAAYAYGGPDQAVSMINRNLDLNIEDYATVGFGGIADMIDTVGGVEIDVQEDEIEHLNNYQSTMAAELGKEYIPVTQTGTQTLNGLQATAYCRIRYTDGGDFKRTERQKEVLTKTFDKLKAAGPSTMIRAAAAVSGEMRTSLSTAEIIMLALQAFRFNITETSGFPQEDLRTIAYIGDQSCVIPIHLTDNVVWLHQYLFSDTSYTVSSTVQTISDTISANSGY